MWRLNFIHQNQIFWTSTNANWFWTLGLDAHTSMMPRQLGTVSMGTCGLGYPVDGIPLFEATPSLLSVSSSIKKSFKTIYKFGPILAFSLSICLLLFLFSFPSVFGSAQSFRYAWLFQLLKNYFYSGLEHSQLILRCQLLIFFNQLKLLCCFQLSNSNPPFYAEECKFVQSSCPYSLWISFIILILSKDVCFCFHHNLLHQLCS